MLSYRTGVIIHSSAVPGYILFELGVPEDIIDQLLRPVDRLYFAGDSFNRTQYGYVHGAYGSGADVAHKITTNIEQCEYNTFQHQSCSVTTSGD